MTGRDTIALLPIILPAYGGVVLMALVAFVRSTRLALWFTIIALAASFGAVFVARGYAPRTAASMIRVDSYSLFFDAVLLAASLLVTLLCGEYLKNHEKRSEAFYVLMLFAVTGMLAIVSSAHFLTFFLGLETLSASLYGLIGYTRRQPYSIEAAIKYLVLAAASSAFLLFGIALIYADAGTMDFARLLRLSVGAYSLLSFFGLGMIAVGVGFKLAWVPFHMWSPDVYQGAPAPVTALIASGSKGAVFALLLRLVSSAFLTESRPAFIALAVLATATMFAGNLLALGERNLKRLLAYSSIAQMGYLLIPIVASGYLGVASATFYLVSYMAAVIAAFGVVSVISAQRESGDLEQISDYSGLAATMPLLAGVLALSFLSLTGVPLTAGFFSKFYIFTAAAGRGLWWLLIVGVVNTGMSAFYYLRVVFALYSSRVSGFEQSGDPETQDISAERPAPGTSISPRVSLAVCLLVIILLGVYPTPLIRLAQSADGSMHRPHLKIPQITTKLKPGR